MTIHAMVLEINRNIHLMAKTIYPWLAEMPSSWPAIVQFLESYMPLIHTTVVRWKCPKRDSYKCNSDGGLESKAFCIRDGHGDLVYAEAWKIDDYSALEAEVKGFKRGLLYCLSHNLIPLIMETDSLIIKKILDGIWEVPWAISVDIREIREAMENKDVTVLHTFREGNKLADYLTNMVVNFAGTNSQPCIFSCTRTNIRNHPCEFLDQPREFFPLKVRFP